MQIKSHWMSSLHANFESNLSSKVALTSSTNKIIIEGQPRFFLKVVDWESLSQQNMFKVSNNNTKTSLDVAQLSDLFAWSVFLSTLARVYVKKLLIKPVD